MSSAMYEEGLHVVPDIKATQARLGSLLALRRAARQAFDKAVSVSRSAIGWVVGMFHRWIEATAGVGDFSWLRGQLGNAAGLIRAAGAVPMAAAFLSAPPVAEAASRLARFVGNGLRRVASAAWSGLKGLLKRSGSTGARIAEGLAHAGKRVADGFRTLAAHPIMVPIATAMHAIVALVRPVSQGLVAHRLLRALVPFLWLRTVVEFMVMPLLFDTTLATGVWDVVSTPSEGPTTRRKANASNVKTSAGSANGSSRRVTDMGMPLIGEDVSVSTDVPLANGSIPTEEASADEELPLNRAARRAQQREDAQAKRPRPRR